MSSALVDTSVLVKWFHSEGEHGLAAARDLLDAHLRADAGAYVLDLGYFELGNVLVGALKWRPADVADQLDDLRAICGVPILTEPDWLRDAAVLARRHRLTFYDAAWAAAARGLDVPLVSADNRLCRSGLAESPRTFVSRLRPRRA